MPSARVVEAFDVLEDRHSGFGLRAKTSAIDELALEAGEKALAHGVVVRVTDGAARRPDANLAAATTKRERRVSWMSGLSGS